MTTMQKIKIRINGIKMGYDYIPVDKMASLLKVPMFGLIDSIESYNIIGGPDVKVSDKEWIEILSSDLRYCKSWRTKKVVKALEEEVAFGESYHFATYHFS